MKRSKIRLSIVSAMVSVSLLGVTGIGAVEGLLKPSASRIGGSWCC